MSFRVKHVRQKCKGETKMKKMKWIDIAVPALFVLALVVLYFFWGCHLDLYVTILAAVILGVTVLTTYIQYKKLDKLQKNEEL